MQVSHFKIKLVFFVNIILFAVVAVRVAYINVRWGDDLIERRERQMRRLIKLEARRGSISDRNGELLAMDVPSKSVFGNPELIGDPDSVAEILSDILHVDKRLLLERFGMKGREFVWIKRKVHSEEARLVSEANLKGIGFVDEMKRVYPNGMQAANLIGFKSDGGISEGLEKVYGDHLKGAEGYVVLDKDGINRNIPGTIREKTPSRDGDDLVLTIDLTLQHIAEKELAETVEKRRAKGGAVIVMDPNTGRVLAMASYPTFDPNDYSKYDQETYRNRAVGFSFEPGSTFKGVLVSSAIDAGIIGPNEKKFVCEGKVKVGRYTIHDSHIVNGGHGSVDPFGIMEHSCNVGATQLGLLMGEERLRKYIRIFGFGERLGLGLNGEEPGLLPPLSRWGEVRTATVSFGHGIMVTPIQVAAAYAAIVNGGSLMKPLLVEEIRGADGKIKMQAQPKRIRRVISEKTAKVVRDMLWLAVSEGTGTSAQIPNYAVGGKTGTTKLAVNGDYDSGKYIASFVGFAPVEDPKVLTYVVIEEPEGKFYGGEVAAPAFQKITQQALWRLNVRPSETPLIARSE